MDGIEFGVTLDNADFQKKLTEMQASLSQVTRQVEEQGAQMESVFGNVKGSVMNLAAQFGLGFSVVGFAKSVATVRGEFQALESSFRTLLGSEQQANDLMVQLTKTAAITPFDLQGVAGAAKQLLAYGTAADEVNDKILQLGDIASGLGLDMGYMAQLYGTTVSKDHMDTMDLKQFKGQGIAIDKAIAEVMGIAQSKVAEAITNGEVSGDIVKAAIENMASGNGQFAGMMENQSKTILGQISNLEDAISTMFNEIGKQSEGVISDVLSVANAVVENYEEVGKAIAGVVAAYGTYKGALMAVSAYQGAGAKGELEMLQQLTAQMELTGDKELEELVRKGALSEAEAKEILTLRAEIEAREQEAQAAFNQAREEKAAANGSVIDAEQRLAQAKAQQQVTIAKIESMTASAATASAEEMESASREMVALSAQREAEAQAIANAEKELTEARTKQVAAGERVEATQRKLNTISIQRQTIAQKAHANMSNLLAGAQKTLKKALDATGLSMLANPYVAVAAAIAAVGYAIYKVTTYTSDYEKTINKLNDARAEEKVQVEQEEKKLASLIDRLGTLKKDSEEYADAKQELIDNYGKYADNLEDEINKTTNLANIHKQLTKAIQDEADVKAYTAAKEGIETEYVERRSDTQKGIYAEIKDYFDGDQQKTENFYNSLNKAIRDGQIKIERTRKGIFTRTDITAKEGDKDAQEMLTLIDKISGGMRLNANDALRERLGNLAELGQNRENALKENKTIFNITDDKLKNVDTIVKREKDKESPTKEIEQEYAGLDDIINKIKKQTAKIAEARNGFRNNLTHKDVLGNEVAYSQKDVETAEKNLKEAKDAYEKATGESWDNISANNEARKKAAYDRTESQRKYEEEQRKQNIQFELDTQQSEINLMNEGAQKKLKQLELNQKKEQIANQDAARERIAKIEEYAKQQFEAEEAEKVRRAGTNKDNQYVAKHFDRNEWLKQQGIETDADGNILFNDDNSITFRANIVFNEEDTMQKGLMQANEANKRATEALFAEQSKARAKAQQDALKEYTEFYSEYIEIETTYNQQIKQLDEEYSRGEIDRKTWETQTSYVELEHTQRLEENGMTGSVIAEKESEIQELAFDITEGTIDLLTQALDEAIQQLRNLPEGVSEETKAVLQAKIRALQEQINTLKGNKKNDLSPNEQTKKKWQDLSKVVGQSSEVIGEVGEICGGVADDIMKVAADIAPIVMNIITSIVTLVVGSSTAMQGTSTVAAESIKTVEKASVILAIIGAALQIAQAMVSLFKKESTAEAYENAKANYESYMKILDKVIDKNLELAQSTQGDADKSAFEKSKEYYEAALETAQKQEQAAREIGKQRANAGASGGSHSYGYRSVRDTTAQGWQEAASAVGMSVQAFQQKMGGRMEGLFDLSIEQLQAIAEKSPEFLRTMDGDMRDVFYDIISYAGTQDDILAQQLEQTLGYTIESLKEDFISLFSDLDDEGETFTQNFSEKLKDAIIGSVVTNEFASRLDAIAKRQNQLSQDGLISVDEYKSLMAEAQQIEDDRKARMEELNNLYNFDQYLANEQDATYGGYETMSEQTGTELSGRFSAMYMVQSEHLELARQMQTMLMSNVNVTLANKNTLEDIRSLQAQANTYLTSIMQYTHSIAQWNERIESIEKHIRENL